MRITIDERLSIIIFFMTRWSETECCHGLYLLGFAVGSQERPKIEYTLLRFKHLTDSETMTYQLNQKLQTGVQLLIDMYSFSRTFSVNLEK